MYHIFKHVLLLIKFYPQTLLNSNQQVAINKVKLSQENVLKSITANKSNKKANILKKAN
jgi:hypothetical protein